VTSSLAVIAIDAVNPRVIAEFWCAVLGWSVLEEDDEVVSIGSPEDSWPIIDVCRVPESKTVKNRLHFDLRADGVERAAELQRLLDLGAKPANVGQRPDASWVVLADPEGNEFCLLARTAQEVGRR
jgi:catechol-2,3-dioxygenase